MTLTARLPALAVACLIAAGGLSGSVQAQTPAQASASAPRSRPSAKVSKAIATRPDHDTGSTGYSVEPVPAWVIPATDTTPAPRPTGVPMHYRLIDDQNRLTGTTREDHVHYVRVVDETSGLSTAAQIEIEFDPSFQSVALHRIDVVRDGQHTSRIDRHRIQVLQRETQLERRMLDGRTTVSLVLADVRIGDEVDVAYTIRGANPVFEGRYADTGWMVSDRGPVQFYRQRLIAPAERQITVRPGSPDTVVETQVIGGVRDTTAVRRSVPAFHVDPGAAGWAALKDQVMATEYADWGTVASWGTALFVEPAGPSPLVDAAVDTIRSAHPLPADRLLAALDLVQKDVRYFGTEIGPGTHRPAAPETVLKQRFGDCKDKVALLLALLRRLDIPASPVLVSTFLRGAVDRLPPTPLGFDHVIARVQLDGSTYWLDATRDRQTGPLVARTSRGFGHGLLLAADTTGLIDLPAAYGTTRMKVADDFTVTGFTDPPVLESHIAYYGDLAESMRNTLAADGVDAVQTRVDEAYVRLYPKLQSLGTMTVEEATDDNAITLVRRFHVSEFWSFPEQKLLTGNVFAWSLADAVRVPSAEARHDALAINAPGLYEHRIRMAFPTEVYGKVGSQPIDDDDARIGIHGKIETTKRSAEVTVSLAIKTSEVAAADWSAYTARVRKVMPRFGMTVSLPPVPLDRGPALQAAIKRIQDDLRDGKIRPVTRLQVEAMVKLVLLDAEIDGGRLDGAILSQALVQRGIQRDNLGHPDTGEADFARALDLTPDDKDALNAAAVNALQRGHMDRVQSYAEKVLQQAPNDAEALNMRMLSRYLSQDWAGASTDIDTQLGTSAGWQRGYPVVMRSLVRQRAGAGTPADAADHNADLPTDWPRPLVDWALGKTDEGAVLDAARASKPSANERLCEAWFYIGERHLASGDVRRARDDYRKAVDLGVTEFVEHGMAQLRLAALEAK